MPMELDKKAVEAAVKAVEHVIDDFINPQFRSRELRGLTSGDLTRAAIRAHLTAAGRVSLPVVKEGGK